MDPTETVTFGKEIFTLSPQGGRDREYYAWIGGCFFFGELKMWDDENNHWNDIHPWDYYDENAIPLQTFRYTKDWSARKRGGIYRGENWEE